MNTSYVGITFDEVLLELRKGRALTRQNWHDFETRVTLLDENGHEQLYKTVKGQSNPWNPTQADILANDWAVLK